MVEREEIQAIMDKEVVEEEVDLEEHLIHGARHIIQEIVMVIVYLIQDGIQILVALQDTLAKTVILEMASCLEELMA